MEKKDPVFNLLDYFDKNYDRLSREHSEHVKKMVKERNALFVATCERLGITHFDFDKIKKP